MSIRTASLVSLTLAALAVSVPASAGGKDKDKGKEPEKTAEEAPDLTQLVKYRELEMGAIARHFGAVKRIVKGEVDRVDDLPGHAAAIQELARDMGSQYPEGTGPDAYPKTDALPKIWEDAEGFAKAVADFEAAAKELGAAAESKDLDAAKAAFEKTGDACGNCHDAFRKDDH